MCQTTHAGERSSSDAKGQDATADATAVLQAQVDGLKAQMDLMREQMDDMKSQRNKWQEQAQSAQRLLTDTRPQRHS